MRSMAPTSPSSSLFQLFLQIISHLLFLTPTSMAKSLSPSVFLKCNVSAIPYPFGIPGFTPFLHGFEVSCNSTITDSGITPLLQINGVDLPVIDINLTAGYVRVLMPFITQRCSHGGNHNQISPLLLDNTPFVYSSTANKLTGVGCDALVLLNSSRPGQKPQHSGCASYCYSSDNIVDGKCSGMGCCQAAIPEGLKSYNLTFQSIRNLTGGFNRSSCQSQKEYPDNMDGGQLMSNPCDMDHSCSMAYILAQDKFVFSKEDITSVSSVHDRNEVVLDWTISNMKCNEAKKDNSYACKENSECYDFLTGYRCNCNQGYGGNPYLTGGCKDVDECEALQPCVTKCRNRDGGFRCICPPGTTGNGLKNGKFLYKGSQTDGTGCKRIQPLSIGLSVGLVSLVLIVVGTSWTYFLFKCKGTTLITILSIGGSTLLVFCGGILLTRKVKERNSRKRKKKCFIRNHGMLLEQMLHSDTTLIERMKLYTIAELEKATNNFDATRVVGGGGHGTVYKGILSDQRVVAVKRSKISNRNEIGQFINEMILLSQVNHRNVVKLYGCCLETEVPLLVFEFVSGGTLSKNLQARNGISILSLEDRLRIAVEVAGALVYLHTYATTSILHRDMKSSNILLDEWCHAKVSDFGASRSVPINQDCITTAVQGTFGYLDPEYFHTRHVTEKSDVYSFGVILVELLTGMTVAAFNNSEGQSLSMHFINSMQQGQLSSAVDAEIVEAGEAEDIESIARIAAACLKLKGEERPAMKEVERKLTRIRRHRERRNGSIAMEQKDFQVYSRGGSSTQSGYSDSSRQYSMEREFMLSYRSPR